MTKLLSTASHVPLIVFVGSDKGGVGKSFTTGVVADVLDIDGVTARLVQVDDQQRLPGLYPDRVTTVLGATLEQLRRDPAAIVAAFDPLYLAIERSVADGVPSLVDIGGPQQLLIEQYCGLVDLDADFVEAGVLALWLIPTTSEPEGMRGAARTARAIGGVLPSVRRVLVLNHRDGEFDFYPGSPADRVWRDEIDPLSREIITVHLPCIAPGSWQPFESAGKRFIDVVSAEIPEIQAWTGRSRPAAKVARGDVASFLASAQSALADLLGIDTGADHAGE